MKTEYWKNLPKQMYLKGDGVVGDCWRCCVAAILRRPFADVPHFVRDSPRNPFRATAEWLDLQGWVFLELHRPHRDWYTDTEWPCILSGPTVRSTSRGEHHAIVAANGDLDCPLYDPHPSGAGLLAVTNWFLLFPHPQKPGAGKSPPQSPSQSKG